MNTPDLPYREIAEVVCMIVTAIAGYFAGHTKGKKKGGK